MNEVGHDVKEASGLITVWGVLTIILGFLAMGAPLVTGLALAVMIGIAMIMAGLRCLGHWYSGWCPSDFFRYDHDGTGLSRSGA